MEIERMECYAGPCGEGAEDYGPLISADEAIRLLGRWDYTYTFSAPDAEKGYTVPWIRSDGRVVTWGQENPNLRRVIHQVKISNGARRLSGANSPAQISTWMWTDWEFPQL